MNYKLISDLIPITLLLTASKNRKGLIYGFMYVLVMIIIGLDFSLGLQDLWITRLAVLKITGSQEVTNLGSYEFEK